MTDHPHELALIQIVAHHAPEFFDSLTDVEKLVLPYMHDLWLRPEQRVLPGPWRYYGFHCGRGFGKTLGIGCEINDRVERGEAHDLAFMAPTEGRVDEVQFKTLIACAPPWFKPTRYRGGLRWPNGVEATVYTPEAPGRPRSGNHDLAWLTEIVDWAPTSRFQAFQNVTTATRVGPNPQVIWDTTSKGRNDVTEHLFDLNAEDPDRYPIVLGTMLDNPMLSPDYLVSEVKKYVGRAREEEVLGRTFKETKGALFKQKWLDDNRRPEGAPEWVCKLVALDPGLSTALTSDPTGMAVGGNATDGHSYLERDLSARMPAEEWGDLTVAECLDRGAAGAVIETNHIGNTGRAVISSRARIRSAELRVIDRADEHKPFPTRTPGVIYLREIHTRDDKGTRGMGPASETEQGLVHLIGNFPELELELTTFEPGRGAKSPNRFDAYNYLIAELRGLNKPDAHDSAKQFAADLKALEAMGANPDSILGLVARSGALVVPGRGRMGLGR